MHRVFVYGTLKVGEPNHFLLEENKYGHAKKLGSAITTEKYPLIIGTKYNIPFLLNEPGQGHLVNGEIYEVDRRMLDKLDELEGHPDYYVRETKKFILKNSSGSEDQVDCWVYILKDYSRVALNKKYHTDYRSAGEHGLPYIESYNESTIEDLMDI